MGILTLSIIGNPPETRHARIGGYRGTGVLKSSKISLELLLKMLYKNVFIKLIKTNY